MQLCKIYGSRRDCSLDGKAKSFVLPEADLNDLPQSKRSLARTRRGNRIARLGENATFGGRDRGVDWRSRLQIVFEYAERTLSREENGGKASVAPRSDRTDVEKSKPDQAADFVTGRAAFARL